MTAVLAVIPQPGNTCQGRLSYIVSIMRRNAHVFLPAGERHNKRKEKSGNSVGQRLYCDLHSRAICDFLRNEAGLLPCGMWHHVVW
jgi:hypothetical protein